jgi:hypothetical protein
MLLIVLIILWNDVSESVLCLRPHVEGLFSWAQSIWLVPLSKDTTSYINCAQLGKLSVWERRQSPVSETSF